MIIYCRVYGWIRNELPPQVLEREYIFMPLGSTVAQVLEILKITETYPLFFVVNGHKVNKDTVLEHNDEVRIIPIIGGG